MTLVLRPIPGDFAVARLAADAGWPHWATTSVGLLSITRTAHETSVVCEARLVPATVVAERGFAAWAVQGPLPFTAVGVVAALAEALARAAIPIFVIATHDTDVVLVPAPRARAAEAAWLGAGIRVTA